MKIILTPDQEKEWDAFSERHSTEVVALAQSYIDGDLTDDQFIDAYRSLGSNRPPAAARSNLKFLKKYFLPLK